MKKISLYTICCLVSINAWAQDEGASNKRLLPNYSHTISLGIENNQLVIKEKANIDSFDLDVNAQLKNSSDTNLIFDALQLDNAHIQDLYKQYVNEKAKNKNNLIDTLINRAKELEGQRIIFSGTENAILTETEVPMYTPNLEDEEGSFNMMQWLFVIVGLMGGLLLGIFLGGKMKKNQRVENNILSNKIAPDNEVLEKTKAELAQIKTSLKQQVDFDQQYFKQSFNSIIVPLETALEARDLKSITPLLIKAMAHYTAITRFKLEKKQSFDMANMQIMMGSRTYQKSEFPSINKSTSPDDIPNKLKTLIQLLKNAEAVGVEESIVSGYKIENL